MVLPNRAYVDDVTGESLRNLWPIDFAMYLDYVGCPCIMKPAFGGGWKNVHKIHSLDELLHHYDESGTLTMMLQEFISWDTFIRVPTIGRRWARAIRYDPAPGAWAATTRTTTPCRAALRDEAEELSLAVQPGARLRHERPRVRGQGRRLLRHRPHELHARPRLPQPQGRPLPVGGREDGGVRGREGPVEGADPQGPRLEVAASGLTRGSPFTTPRGSRTRPAGRDRG